MSDGPPIANCKLNTGWVYYAGLLAFGLAGCVAAEQELAQDYNNGGVSLYQDADYAGARESFKAALALRPEDPELCFNLGASYDRLGNLAKAEEFYGRCLARSPNHAECRHALTVLLVRAGRRQDAVRMVADWMAREPKLPGPYVEDAWLWRQAGDLPRAQARLHQAMEVDPHDMPALVLLGQVYEDLSRPDRALVLYERVLDRDPRQPALVSRVNCLLAKGAGRPQPE